MARYRELKDHEVVKENDEYFDHHYRRWFPAARYEGKVISDTSMRTTKVRRPLNMGE